MLDIKIKSRKIKLSEKDKMYIFQKIGKHEELLSEATLIDTEIVKETKKPVNNIKVQINVNLPRAFIKVEEQGEDLRTIIDSLESTLFRRLKRYNDLYNKWRGKAKWKLARTPKDISQEELDSYKDYEPYIAKHTTYDDDSPKHPAEAIEAMELMGNTAYLFRNIENNKYCMLYKKISGDYVLVEPPDR